jgi:hypothetical protein
MRKFLFLILFLILICSLVFVRETKAGSGDNLSGWAWSENVGWISFNCYNDYNGDGVLENHCSSSNYGVRIDPSTKVFSGYAWSENVGWITFNESELSGCPQAPCRAWLGSDNKVYGWARALAGKTTQSGGWDGWIKLQGANYGVTFNPSTGEFEGWAAGWDDTKEEAIVGWISFNCKNQNSCSKSDYKVYLRNLPPTITKFKVTDEPCAYESYPLTIPNGGYIMWINWDAQDPNNDPLTARITIVGRDTNFSTTTAKKSFIVPPEAGIDFNTQYTITLEVSDGKNSVSTSTTFKTPLHQYPYVNFKWSPEKPLVNQVVQFCSVSTGTCAEIITEDEQSECYAPACTWSWTFTSAIPSNSNFQNPQVRFTSATSAEVTLRISPSDIPGAFCEKTEKIQIRKPLPRWELMKLKIENFFASLIEFLKKILLI